MSQSSRTVAGLSGSFARTSSVPLPSPTQPLSMFPTPFPTIVRFVSQPPNLEPSPIFQLDPSQLSSPTSSVSSTTPAPHLSSNYTPLAELMASQSNEDLQPRALSLPMPVPLYIVEVSKQRIKFLEMENANLKNEVMKLTAENTNMKSVINPAHLQISENIERISSLEYEKNLLQIEYLGKDKELEASKHVIRKIQDFLKLVKMIFDENMNRFAAREEFWKNNMNRASQSNSEMLIEIQEQSKKEKELVKGMNSLIEKHNKSNPSFKIPMVPERLVRLPTFTSNGHMQSVAATSSKRGIQNGQKEMGPAKRQREFKQADTHPSG